MPLCEVNCKPMWYPPETGPDSENHIVVIGLVQSILPVAAAKAVNVVDELVGKNVITRNQVFVNIGHIHSYAANAEDMQLIIRPGLGGLDPASPEQRVRRVMIREIIQDEIAGMRQELLDEGSKAPWPSYDIEVIPTDMSGLTVNTIGEVTGTWGGPNE